MISCRAACLPKGPPNRVRVGHAGVGVSYRGWVGHAGVGWSYRGGVESHLSDKSQIKLLSELLPIHIQLFTK